MALFSLVAAALLLGQINKPLKTLAKPPPVSRKTSEKDLDASHLAVPIQGYVERIPSWLVQIHPNSSEVLLNGTVQEIERQAIAMNPNWKKEFFGDDELDDDDDDDGELTTRSLDKRAFFSIEKLQCRDTTRSEWKEGRVQAIREGINHLRGVPGRPSRGAGPGVCERVSCSYGSAIWWCNDAYHQKFLDTYGDIADGASHVLHHCRAVERGRSWFIIGQAFHNDDWNVIVRDGEC